MFFSSQNFTSFTNLSGGPRIVPEPSSLLLLILSVFGQYDKDSATESLLPKSNKPIPPLTASVCSSRFPPKGDKKDFSTYESKTQTYTILNIMELLTANFPKKIQIRE